MSLGVMLWYHVGVGHPLMRYILARLVACLTVSRHLSGVGFAIESMIVKKNELGGVSACGKKQNELATQSVLLHLLIIAFSYRFSAFALCCLAHGSHPCQGFKPGLPH